ncbi:MAG: site-2 protease family protein [Oscillospiraceae bacterium]|nr:site-2 protease family protein [Oscillospiraceae bacterium]
MTTIFNFFIKALVLFTAVPIHECAHAWTAEKLGDDTAKRQGRVTLNPFAHLSLWGSIMLVLVGFGWGKPVQTNPNNFKKPKRDMALTALAGPVSNFLMAFISMIVYKVLYYTTSTRLAYIFLYIMIINISLAVFNFLPIPPLDGSKIFNALLPEKIYFGIMKYENIISIVVLVLVWSGLLDTPLGFLQSKVISIMNFLTGWIDVIFSLARGVSSV